jgi:DNA-binding transcriptional MerR regulator
MTAELGLNLAGVERVLALEEQMEELQAQMLATEAAAQQARAELEAELEKLRRSMSADIVRYSGATTDIVLAADARSPFKSARER